MTTIDFNVPMEGADGKKTFFTPDGKEHLWGTLAQHFAKVLGEQTDGNTLKLFGWMKALQAGKRLQLDEADKKVLIQLIEENKKMFVFFKGQLLEVIEKSKSK